MNLCSDFCAIGHMLLSYSDIGLKQQDTNKKIALILHMSLILALSRFEEARGNSSQGDGCGRHSGPAGPWG
jgi:hypothetical protein